MNMALHVESDERVWVHATRLSGFVSLLANAAVFNVAAEHFPTLQFCLACSLALAALLVNSGMLGCALRMQVPGVRPIMIRRCRASKNNGMMTVAVLF